MSHKRLCWAIAHCEPWLSPGRHCPPGLPRDSPASTKEPHYSNSSRNSGDFGRSTILSPGWKGPFVVYVQGSRRHKERRRAPGASSWSKKPSEETIASPGMSCGPSENKSSRGWNWSFVVLARRKPDKASLAWPSPLIAKEMWNLSASRGSLFTCPQLLSDLPFPWTSHRSHYATSETPGRPGDLPPSPLSGACGMLLSCFSSNQKLLLAWRPLRFFFFLWQFWTWTKNKN